MPNKPPTAVNPHAVARTPVLRGFDARKQYHHLYNNSRWRKLRMLILLRDPICTDGCVCQLRNPSTVADHIKDHRGNEKMFWDEKNIRGVCKPCHDFKTGSQHGSDRKPEAPKPLENGIVANQGTVAVTEPDVTLNDAVDYKALLSRHQLNTGT